jgi:monoterpene epsilon-lactone hydrolase
VSVSLTSKIQTRLLVEMANRMHIKPDDLVPNLRGAMGPPAKPGVTLAGVDFSEAMVGAIPAELIHPAGETSRQGLFVHGGGYIAGTATHFRKFFGTLALKARLSGPSINYRLAPENPFPAAIDDCVLAYEAMLDDGADPKRLFMTGESAGGNILLASLLVARDRGLAMPAGLVLWWPQTDFTLSGQSIRSNRGRDFLTPAFIEIARDMYLGGADPRDPRASPLFANLEGLPPTIVFVGERDLIRDDGVRLAEKMDAELYVGKDMIHGWATAGDDTAEARSALDHAAAWIGERCR